MEHMDFSSDKNQFLCEFDAWLGVGQADDDDDDNAEQIRLQMRWIWVRGIIYEYKYCIYVIRIFHSFCLSIQPRGK